MTTPTSYDIASSKRGGTYRLLYADVNVYTTIVFDAENWMEGLMASVSYDDALRADETTGVWTGSVPLEAIVDPSEGIHITWVGSGVTVEWSTDAATWTPVTSGSTFLEDAATTGLFLYIRITFPDTDAWVESLRLDFLAERIMAPFSGTRNISFKGASFDHTADHQSDFQADSGATLRNGGYLQIEPDEDLTPVRTLEMWLKVDDTTGFIMRSGSNNYVRVDSPGNIVFTGATVYRDGATVASGTSIPQGQWNHYVIVLSADFTTEVKIGNNLAGDNPLNMNVGHLAYYPYAMTATEASNLYKTNVGTNIISIVEPNDIVLAERNPSHEVYAYSWAVTND